MIELELQQALLKQRDAARESIIQSSDVLSTPGPSQGGVAETTTNRTQELVDRASEALSTLMEARLLELQMTHENLVAGIDELEAKLKMAGGELAALSDDRENKTIG